MDYEQKQPLTDHTILAEFRQKLTVDYKLYWHDVLSSVAHAKMLGETGIIAKEEAERIGDGLISILADIEKGALEIENADDVQSFIENELVKRIGAVGKKLCTARSRADVAATDLRLYMKDAVVSACGSLKNLIETLLDVADTNVKFYMPAYTHGKNQCPVNVAHFFNAYSEMFLRDIDRLTDCYKRTDVCPLGSGEVAGTSFVIDRKRTAELLNFSEISQNSMDAVSDRDYIVEFLFCTAMALMHLGKLAQELIRLSSDELAFIRIGEEFTVPDPVVSGKRNPDVLELIRGKSAKAYGGLTTALTAIRSLPLSNGEDDRDLYEAAFEGKDILTTCTDVMAALLKSIAFDTRAMRFAAAGGFSAAGDVIDYLIEKGMTFREAKATTDQIVSYCVENQTNLERIDEFTYQNFSTLFGADIVERVKVKEVAESKRTVGGTSRTSVRENIRSIQRRLQRNFK